MKIVPKIFRSLFCWKCSGHETTRIEETNLSIFIKIQQNFPNTRLICIIKRNLHPSVYLFNFADNPTEKAAARANDKWNSYSLGCRSNFYRNWRFRARWQQRWKISLTNKWIIRSSTGAKLLEMHSRSSYDVWCRILNRIFMILFAQFYIFHFPFSFCFPHSNQQHTKNLKAISKIYECFSEIVARQISDFPLTVGFHLQLHNVAWNELNLIH